MIDITRIDRKEDGTILGVEVVGGKYLRRDELQRFEWTSGASYLYVSGEAVSLGGKATCLMPEGLANYIR